MEHINIEVAYARPDCQRIITLQVPAGITVLEALKQSEIQKIFPEIDFDKNAIGIFSRPAKLSDVLKSNDRIEIYRPLVIDPKDARRERVKNKKF